MQHDKSDFLSLVCLMRTGSIFLPASTRYVFHHHILIFLPSDSRPLSFHALLPAPCQRGIQKAPNSKKSRTDRQIYLKDNRQTRRQTRLRTEWLFGVRPQESPVSGAHLTTEQKRGKRAEQRAIKEREKLLNLDQHFALNFAVQNEQNIRREIAQVLRYDCRLNLRLSS